MKIKKYVAKSMREALIEIRKELGDSAIILKTRKMPGRGFPFSGPDIEVTAAIDDDAVPQPAFPRIAVRDAQPVSSMTAGVYNRPRQSCIVDSAQPVTIKPWQPPVIDKPPIKDELPVKMILKEGNDLVEIKDDIKDLATLVKSVIATGGARKEGRFVGGWGVLYKRLLDAEVKPAIAERLIGSMKNDEAAITNGKAEEKLIALLKGHFPATGPIKCNKRGPRMVALVGPTGSGKTTTIAKLVAHCCLGKKRKVSIITADTYRIAAIDQIRAFADIVKVPLHVVFSMGELRPALAACLNDDLVFIDTAGRSRAEQNHMKELENLLRIIRPDEVHCVVSATTKDSDLFATVEQYRAVGADRLLFTKLDETVHIGNIFNATSEIGIPVSFFTTGQSVPEDIELAQPGRFVQRLWQETAV
ncbi:MAG: flagellar biosynthesis protein FlhF [Chitinispirillaceae bacterium]|nr:flagellar biosynthesis protein FlhF [Chitinispirillaceae bacterium]